MKITKFKSATETTFSYPLLFAKSTVSNELKIIIFLSNSNGRCFFSCRNRLFGAKLRPGSGTEFKDLVTSLAVFTHEALQDFLFSHFLLVSLLFFILSTPSFLPCNFCPVLTGNTHHRRGREPKCVDSPK